jgi:acetylornithine aminotransferase/acetylornithine/N-succinyldiaminopimelate aminotransferase
VRFVRCNDVEDLKRKFDASVCGVAVEAVQGEGGINPVAREFIQAARVLTKQSGALLLSDEIQSGLGRTGRPFAYQHYRVKPDIVTVAKPLANGLPLGAILTTSEVATAFHPGMHGTTFGGGPLACAVAVAVLDTMEREDLLAHVNEVGDYFKRRLVELAARHECVRDVRGLGLMLGLELDDATRAKAVLQGLLERGIIINRTHDVVLRFLPPYIITRKHVDTVVDTLDELLASTAPSAKTGRKGGTPAASAAPAAAKSAPRRKS